MHWSRSAVSCGPLCRGPSRMTSFAKARSRCLGGAAVAAKANSSCSLRLMRYFRARFFRGQTHVEGGLAVAEEVTRLGSKPGFHWDVADVARRPRDEHFLAMAAIALGALVDGWSWSAVR